ncbi:phosphate transporter [Lactarius psammicola]|nr:phosphate transporter [Lactarius psammicola]
MTTRSWFHVKVCLVAGTGFFTDAYDIFAINLASVMLGCVYGQTKDFGIKVAAPIGNLFGQLLFGWPADILGRKRMWGCPLSAVITSEFASTRIRGRLMMAVFTAQGWGNFVVGDYKDSIVSGNVDRVDYCWRILIGLGRVPGVITLYFRLTIPETPRFMMDIDRDVRRAATDIRNVLDVDAVVQRVYAPRRSGFMAHFGQGPNLQLLIGVTYSWFAVAFHGLGLNSTTILTSEVLTLAGIGDQIECTDSVTLTYKTLHNVAKGNLVVSLAGLLPGYYATFFLIDVWGRKPIQFMGFSALTVLLAVIAGIYPGTKPTSDEESKIKAFVALYCLAIFFTNFGPNVTTFIIPGEIFPTRYRSTAHGIAAASGEFGAIVSQVIFFTVTVRKSGDMTLRTILGIFAGVSLTGIASTWLLDETKNRSVEELSHEQQRGFIHGVTPVEMRNGVAHRRGSVYRRV